LAGDKFRRRLPSDMINLLNPINKQRGSGPKLKRCVAMRECESCVRSQRGKVPSFNCESLAGENLGLRVENLAWVVGWRKLPHRHTHTLPAGVANCCPHWDIEASMRQAMNSSCSPPPKPEIYRAKNSNCPAFLRKCEERLSRLQ